MTDPPPDKGQLSGLGGETSIASLSFDELLERLENVVQQLESDELTLDQSIDTFEHGVRLAARCQQLLSDAELRISQITDEIGGTAPYATYGERGDDVDDDEI